jgi:predicted branched-subunit amino acid permease
MEFPELTAAVAQAHRNELLGRADMHRRFRSRPLMVSAEKAAVSDTLPVMAALAPFALLIGVTIGSFGGNRAAGLSGAPLLYAGSAHLSAISLLGHGAPALTVVGTIALINARFLVYSAALAPYFADQPRWFRWLAPHFIVDQAYGLVLRRNDLDDPVRFRRYWFTVSAVILVGWTSAMSIGVLLGPAVPDVAATTMLPISAFLMLLGPKLASWPAVIAAATAAAVTLGAPAPGPTRVLVGLVTGAIAGWGAEQVPRRGPWACSLPEVSSAGCCASRSSASRRHVGCPRP